MREPKQKFKDGSILGVKIFPLKKHVDERGWLAEIFRTDELDPQLHPVMAYVSESLPGVTRGPHEHLEQTDYFCFMGPSSFEVTLWDNRESSSSHWTRQRIVLGEQNPSAIIVPAGVVHAYRNVGEKPGWVLNFSNRLYAGKGKKGPIDEIRHENNPQSPFRLITP